MSREPASPAPAEPDPPASDAAGPADAARPAPSGQLRTPLPHPGGDDEGEVVFAPAEVIARALRRSGR